MHTSIQYAIQLLNQAKRELELTPIPGFTAAEDKVAETISFIKSIDDARNVPVVKRKNVQQRYVGDIGVVRKVLKDFGFDEEHALYYNDKSKATGHRRIKCSSATRLHNQGPNMHLKVFDALNAAFGTRMTHYYFIKQPRYYGNGMQLCIKLSS